VIGVRKTSDMSRLKSCAQPRSLTSRRIVFSGDVSGFWIDSGDVDDCAAGAQVRLRPSSALNQVNDHHDNGNYEQKIDQTAADVDKGAQKPEHD